jgi:hypothetical protein
VSAELRFTVTPEHLTLARAMRVRWDGCEYGAPAIDCKRPYGNSDVESDIRRILGLEEDVDPAVPYLLHRDMETVLQIALRAGRFEAGEYVADRYRANWRPAEVSL